MAFLSINDDFLNSEAHSSDSSKKSSKTTAQTSLVIDRVWSVGMIGTPRVCKRSAPRGQVEDQGRP